MSWPVSEQKRLALEARMRRMGVAEGQFEERFVRSQGSGGQNVNKVSTCVVLRHLPSGIEVRCQRERSQGLNRFLARRLLLDRLEAQRTGHVAAERARAEKLRRQKRRRSRRAKAKMLEQKRLHSAKKALRARPSEEGQ